MAGEWQFLPGREDPQAVVGPLGRRRADERRLGQVRPGRDRLHLLARHSVAVEHHRDWVALERHLGEYVDLLDREPLHPGPLSLVYQADRKARFAAAIRFSSRL